MMGWIADDWRTRYPATAAYVVSTLKENISGFKLSDIPRPEFSLADLKALLPPFDYKDYMPCEDWKTRYPTTFFYAFSTIKGNAMAAIRGAPAKPTELAEPAGLAAGLEAGETAATAESAAVLEQVQVIALEQAVGPIKAVV